MISPMLTRIGEPQRTIEVDRPPIPIRRKVEPIKIPEMVPVRRVVPERREPDKQVWANYGFKVEEIPYACPSCGRELEQEDGVLSCPEHGIMYE